MRTFKYDDLGQLIECKEDKGLFKKITYLYTYDEVGNRLTARKKESFKIDQHAAYTYNADNQMIAAFYCDECIQTDYTYQYDANGNLAGYYQYGGHGSVTSVTNDYGMVKDVFQYAPYGQVTLGSKEHESFYAYSGENFNPNTVLEYLRSRYYNTAMGRFQTEDTYLGNLNTPLILNRYSYVMNNPINYIDPSGHMAAKQFTNTVLGSNAAAVVNPNLKKSNKKVDVGNSNSLTSRTVRTLKSSAAPSVPVPGNASATTVSNARQAVNKVRAQKDCGTDENKGFLGWARDRANDLRNFMDEHGGFALGVATGVVATPE